MRGSGSCTAGQLATVTLIREMDIESADKPTSGMPMRISGPALRGQRITAGTRVFFDGHIRLDHVHPHVRRIPIALGELHPELALVPVRRDDLCFLQNK